MKLIKLEFLSTLSLRRATTGGALAIQGADVFLSTLSLRRATETSPYRVVETHISIHALLAESDKRASGQLAKDVISIHALLAESDL